ncbi:MAG: CehA/McbA family metallohydrolase, partial [Planctomycetes bacterium]|nr:CehA/McbA family metallohydrolase [Planctomycetota bacterium]
MRAIRRQKPDSRWRRFTVALAAASIAVIGPIASSAFAEDSSVAPHAASVQSTPEALWEILGDGEPARAYAAMWELVRQPASAVAFLDRMLQPASVDVERFDALVSDLDDRDSRVRGRAQRELARLGSAAEERLRRAAGSAASIEARLRLLRALAQLERDSARLPESRRTMRAVRALEHIGTPEAAAVLERLAGGAPGAWQTGRARQALDRLKRLAAGGSPWNVGPGDWPQFGGREGRNHVGRARHIPTDFDPATGRRLKWSAALGSQTYGNPVVANGLVFIGTNNGAGYVKRFPKDIDLGCLLCFDEETGGFLWQHSNAKLATGRVHDWPLQGVCSTPAVDGDRLWYVTNRGEVVCLDTAGFLDGENDGPFRAVDNERRDEADVVWSLDMMGRLGVSQHNMANCSVTTVGDLLFVNTSNGVDEGHINIPAPQAPSFLAMDRETGEVLWTDNSPGQNILHGQWSSPTHCVVDGRPQVLFAGGDGWLYSFDPQGDGRGGSRLLWKFDCNPKTSKWMLGGRSTRNNIIGVPVVYRGLVYIAVGQDPEHGEGEGHVWCIDPTGSGDVSPEVALDAAGRPLAQRRLQAVDPERGERTVANPQSALVWHYDHFDLNGNGEIEFEETMHRTCGSVAVENDLLIVADFSGLVHCVDALTGRPFWTYDLFAACWGSPLIVDDKVFIGDEDGDLAIFRLSADPAVAMRQGLPAYGEFNLGNSIYVTPVAANDTLYIADKTTLFAFRSEPEKPAGAAASPPARVLDAGLHHLRIEGKGEWDEFPAAPEAARLELKFSAEENADEQTLSLRQQDVKQDWRVRLNDKSLGTLRRDENDMRIYLAVPAGALRSGENELRIEQTGRQTVPDDIRVGELSLDSRPVREVLSDATVAVAVTDGNSGDPLPARITVLDESGSLQTPGAESSDRLAVRPGTIYTADGEARFGLPAGRFTLHAGRGFEYSLATAEITVELGETVSKTLTIRREVPTEGYVACDTHVHSLTHSGHGDATVDERMITIAAEGIELPVATDHNVHVDHEPFARRLGLRKYFTPVVGNEVTTKVGHFNIFPVPADAKPPDHTLTDWPAIIAEIDRATGAKVVILNHARDLHSGVRPFGPGHYNAVAAENLDGWPLDFNGIEVINSGATQTDVLRLARDWMELLNRGLNVAPVGSSDSHDVARHFVGQGRTYIRCHDSDPGNIDVAEAVANFRAGRVSVSYGLLTELTVDGRYGPGETAPAGGDELRVEVRVLGPHWTVADRIELFANGRPVREAKIQAPPFRPLPDGVKWSGGWTLPRPTHDLHFVAIATGPGIDGPYWKTAKPYQPTSPRWTPRTLGVSGAVWLDADGDGRRSCARDYAERVFDTSQGEPAKLLPALASYDEAVAAHAAWLYQRKGGDFTSPELREALKTAAPHIRAGFDAAFTA